MMQTGGKDNPAKLNYWHNIGIALLSFWFVVVHCYTSETYDGARLPELTSGVANLPYQFRALVPWIVRGLNRWDRLIFGNKTFLDSITEGVLGGVARDKFDNCDPTLLLIYLLLEWVALILLVKVSLKILWFFQEESGMKKNSCNGLMVLILFIELFWNYTLPFEHPWWYSSDIVGVTFYTWGVYKILKGEWLGYGLLFFIGAWNKETVIFLIPFFYFRAISSFPEPLVAALAVAQLVVWSGIKYILGIIYGHNRGFLFHPNIIENVELMFSFKSWLIVASCGGGLLIVALFYTILAKNQNRKLLLSTYILFFIGILFGGRITELRAYGELLPLTAAVVIGNFRVRVGQVG